MFRANWAAGTRSQDEAPQWSNRLLVVDVDLHCWGGQSGAAKAQGGRWIGDGYCIRTREWRCPRTSRSRAGCSVGVACGAVGRCAEAGIPSNYCTPTVTTTATASGPRWRCTTSFPVSRRCQGSNPTGLRQDLYTSATRSRT